MELQHLGYFTLVVQCQGYRQGSRRLHVAHPVLVLISYWDGLLSDNVNPYKG